MKRYKKVYMDFFQLTQDDRVPCEVCRKSVAVDLHHCEQRGMGGDPTGKKDVIENLIGVCRACHDECEADPDQNVIAKSLAKNLEFRKFKMKQALFRGC